ncbi:CHASE2 domain-containing protein [Chroococcidiopsis sp. TS-821]|uniref:CHASE2 domain-containing protein n=1 Tax=Chroococcidiopsis sp. TS-821 TaxID=1378066 RepID=UPI000CEEE1E7|nr:CHASE2 domain-containing protein [Chroococcidiopsis sp. TS-821]PPS45408.1 sensor protein Chase2 [Chroococcidiopsis sp. TS-821]
MAKLVVLKVGEGSFEQGFPVTMQIGEEGDAPAVQTLGKLPPAPEIPQYYNCWQSAYLCLGHSTRLEAKPVQVTNVSVIEDCWHAVQILRNRLNSWIHSESFRAIREKWLEKLSPSDEIRAILQTEDLLLQRLPWHFCDFFERYPKAELALSAPAYERVKQVSQPKDKVAILAILGDSTGIDTQADRALLEKLPGAMVQFLVEPQRQELNNQLWSQGWDILFFAGHSSSLVNGDGRICLNRTESLSISDLKYALKTAVAHGLRLAIFNSCDGLGLARELANLYIPQVIVMREPVPDIVAQEFLKNFLYAFAGGQSFYLSVREARERLQGLEDEYPCASWLPVIYQNPAETPPLWAALSRSVSFDRSDNNQSHQRSRKRIGWQHLWRMLLTSSLVTVATWGVRYLGAFESLELKVFDQFMRLRPHEATDPRLLVVAITEEDFKLPEQKNRTGSLSDLALAKLLEKLEQYQPRAIGLDIYREEEVNPQFKDLAQYMQQSDRFIAVCKISEPTAKEDPSVAPPPEIPEARQGFSDVVLDPDGVLRRYLVAVNPHPASICSAPYAFSTQLAFRYLAAEGIFPQWTSQGHLQLGNVILPRLQPHTGGYQTIDAAGFQMLLNYRSYRSPEDIANKVTLTEVLQNRVKPDDVRNRIVLIGVTAPSAGDYFATPYSTSGGAYQKMAGVFVHAQMVSQILSAVQNQRPLLWVLPQGGEFLWIWGWAILGSVLAWRYRSVLHLELALAITMLVLYALCFALLAYQSCWMPFVPSALALIATSTGVVVQNASQKQGQSTDLYARSN